MPLRVGFQAGHALFFGSSLVEQVGGQIELGLGRAANGRVVPRLPSRRRAGSGGSRSLKEILETSSKRNDRQKDFGRAFELADTHPKGLV